MPVLPGTLTSSPSSSCGQSPTTTTAQMVMDAMAADLQNASISPATALDYVNRIQLDLLKVSRWKFLMSAPEHFITEQGQTDYYIGDGPPAPGSVQTGLVLADVEFIKEGSVFDRSNYRELQKTDEPPLLARLGFQDDTSRPGRPLVWRNSLESPCVFNIYPAPDNQNTYQPIPASPYLMTTTAGALLGRTYYARATFVDSAGNESAASAESRFYIPANTTAQFRSPAAEAAPASSGITYSYYNVYLGTNPNTAQLQNNFPIAIGTDWLEPISGLVAGTSYPTANNLEPMRGYLIEFRYFKRRQQVTQANQILQIPDTYKPVVIAGVNWIAAQMLNRYNDVPMWEKLYREGVMSIVRDKNLFPKGDSFIGPDSASLGRMLPSIESMDTTRFLLP